MKESFIFYGSFLNAIEQFSDKSQLKLYKVLCNFALKNENYSSILNKKELAIFELIKPQILANNKRYEDGCKGGRPKKTKTTGYENKKPNENDNVNVNENVNVNVNENGNGFFEKEKNDPFINPIKTFFISEYEKQFQTKPFLSAIDCNKLIELSSEHKDIRELIPVAISKLKGIEFKDIDFKPSASWLLKSNNFERVLNGEFESKKQETWQEKMLREAGIK